MSRSSRDMSRSVRGMSRHGPRTFAITCVLEMRAPLGLGALRVHPLP